MSKKKIICYGVANMNLRRRMNWYLANRYEVIAYSDSFYKEDVLQGEKFVPVEEIVHMEFDYVVILAEKEHTQEKITETLLQYGISDEKIIMPVYLYQENILYSPDLLDYNINILNSKEIDGGILGLSYSLVGIAENKLKGNFLNFSWHGLDLYYNWQFLKYSLKKTKFRRILMFFPYYYFNYDASSSLYQFTSGQIFACRSLGDWHNARKSRNRMIKNYVVNEEMFGEHLWGGTWKKYCLKNENVINDGKYELSPIWKRVYKKTYLENTEIMKELLFMLEKMEIKFYLIVPPLYSACLLDGEIKWIDEQRKSFYTTVETLKRYQIKVFDCFDLYKEKREYFYDYEHLNEKGKIEFTTWINEKVLS